MKKSYLAAAILVALAPVLLLPTQSSAQTPPAAAAKPANTVRPAIGMPMTAAQNLFRDKKFPEALVKLDEAAAVPMRTPYETYVIERTRGAVAASMADNALLAKSLEAVLATGVTPAEEAPLLVDSLTKTYFRLKDHPKTVEWGLKAVEAGAVGNETRLMLAQSAFLIENFDVAKRHLGLLVEQAEKAGTKPPESQYRLLANIALKQKDNVAYESLIEKLATHYYKKDYLADLLARVYAKPDFPEKLMTDVRRLRFVAGITVDGTEYNTLAELVFRGGFPSEAKKILDEAYAKGMIKADDVERKKFRDNVEREVAEEAKQAARPAGAANKDPNAMLNNGYNFVIQGQAEKGLAMMEQALTNSAIKNPEESKLRLGIAQTIAGQKAKALATFKSVGGPTGLVDLARMWSLYAAQLPTGA